MSHKIVVFGAILERFWALELRGTNGARALGRGWHAPRGVLAEMHYQRFGQIRHAAAFGEVVPVVCKIGPGAAFGHFGPENRPWHRCTRGRAPTFATNVHM